MKIILAKSCIYHKPTTRLTSRRGKVRTSPKSSAAGVPYSDNQLYRVTDTIVMNLVKGEPRDAGPKLTATSGLALALARSSQPPNHGGKNATLALSDLCLLNIQNRLATVATRSRSSKFSTDHEPTGRTFREQKIQ